MVRWTAWARTALYIRQSHAKPRSVQRWAAWAVTPLVTFHSASPGSFQYKCLPFSDRRVNCRYSAAQSADRTMVRHYKPVEREHLPKTRVSATKASECARLIEQGLSDLVVSKQTGVSNRQVHRYRLNLQKWGNVHVPASLRTSGPPRAMNEDMVNKMLEYLRDRPGAQLEELAKYLQEVYGKTFSTSQLSNRLKEKGWTRTIVSLICDVAAKENDH